MREEALQILRENNIRRTNSRVAMLEVMLEEDRPLDAKEIFTKVEAKMGQEAIWLSTVYRNLEAFEAKGLLHQVRIPDSDSIYYHLYGKKHEHYAICENCRKEIPLNLCYINKLSDSLEEKGFTPKYHRLEIFGICEECSKL